MDNNCIISALIKDILSLVKELIDILKSEEVPRLHKKFAIDLVKPYKPTLVKSILYVNIPKQN